MLEIEHTRRPTAVDIGKRIRPLFESNYPDNWTGTFALTELMTAKQNVDYRYQFRFFLALVGFSILSGAIELYQSHSSGIIKCHNLLELVLSFLFFILKAWCITIKTYSYLQIASLVAFTS